VAVLHQGIGDVTGHPFLVGEAVADRVDKTRDAAKAVQPAAGQVGDMRNAAKGHQMMRADAMNGDAADDDHVAARVGEAIAESLGRINVVAAEQALLPQLAHAHGRLAGVHGVGIDAAGVQQVGDGLFEGDGVEAAMPGDAEAAFCRAADIVVGHGRSIGYSTCRHDTACLHLLPLLMALKATIFKTTLQVADIDRNYYAEQVLTLARHPSETDERMMMRLLAFAFNADDRLEFGRGLSTEDEPALWLRDYGGNIKLWIEVGLPDERSLRRAAGRAERVVVFAYGGRAVDVWWERESKQIARLDKATVWSIASSESSALAALAARNMTLHCTIQDGQALLSSGETTLTVEPLRLHGG
jgi:uncharacterized protein YaeQ